LTNFLNYKNLFSKKSNSVFYRSMNLTAHSTAIMNAAAMSLAPAAAARAAANAAAV
jgi:hypothetical protein